MFDLALQNLLSPMVLFFALGLLAALARSDLSVPEAITRLLSLYLLLSIGFRGGVEVNHHGLSGQLLASLLAGVVLSLSVPLLAFAVLRQTTPLSQVDAAAVAGHYGSISAVTFAAVTTLLTQQAIAFDGYLVAVAAAMETPAIFVAVLLGRWRQDAVAATGGATLLREVLLNGSIVILLGAFIIGLITGPHGLTLLKPLFLDSFNGFLCLFLLDMGLLAGQGLQRGWARLSPAVITFALVMPLLGALLAGAAAWLVGLSLGSSAVLITLGASASYIAVPSALRLALPAADAALGITLALGLTFPFNMLVGLPLYLDLARYVAL
jgi:hypothetical protein